VKKHKGSVPLVLLTALIVTPFQTHCPWDVALHQTYCLQNAALCEAYCLLEAAPCQAYCPLNAAPDKAYCRLRAGWCKPHGGCQGQTQLTFSTMASTSTPGKSTWAAFTSSGWSSACRRRSRPMRAATTHLRWTPIFPQS